MANEVSRITEFQEEDFRTNHPITLNSESLISEKEWKEFAKNALVLIDSWEIRQYAEEYPIVKYKSSKWVNKHLGQVPLLNPFVEEITVSTACYGKVFSVGSGKMEKKIADGETVIYFQDNVGIHRTVRQHDIRQMLLKKPELVVTPEGMLLFFTEKYMIATLDLNHYIWVHDITGEGGVIVDVEANSDCSVVTVKSDAGINRKYRLTFSLDFAALQPLEAKLEKI